jgi:hypothetical protein
VNPNFKWKPPSRTKHVCCAQISNGTHLQEQNILYPNFNWNQIQEQEKIVPKFKCIESKFKEVF